MKYIARTFTLQEGTARLTIHSELSLGQCLRNKYRHTTKIYNSAIICWVVATCVILGNTLYECNNWAGGIDAVMSMPGASELDSDNPDHQTALTGIRVGCCLAYLIECSAPSCLQFILYPHCHCQSKLVRSYNSVKEFDPN